MANCNVRVTHVEIFYLDAKNGWAVAEFDEEGNQICYEASTHYRKTDAKNAARKLSDKKLPIWVFNSNGERMKNLLVFENGEVIFN